MIRTRGRLRDLTAALNRALDTRDLALLHTVDSDPAGARNYELIGLRGESGFIRAEFPPPTGEPAALREPRDIVLTARLGLLGEPDREADLLRALAGELEALNKREY